MQIEFEDKFEEFFTEAERIAKNKGKKDTLEPVMHFQRT
jgi:hypothetical protein